MLEPGQSATIALPHRGRDVELSMSGGNVASLPRGTELGTIDFIGIRGSAFRRSVRVGEISDWSALSPDQHWRNQNGPPAVPRGPLEGLGSRAFLNGSGVVRTETPVEVAAIRVTASDALPPSARLHLDAVRLMR